MNISCLSDGRLPIPNAEAMCAFLTSDGTNYLLVPHGHNGSLHPTRHRAVYYLGKVAHRESTSTGIPGVRYGVYQVTTDGCPPGYIAPRRLPHFDCAACMAGDHENCPLSFAGAFILHKVAEKAA